MAGKTLLVVEDDLPSRTALALALEDEGYTVLTAEDGDEALEFLQSGQAADLILLDMMMPSSRCDGWQFLAVRNQHPMLARIPVVITTAISVASHEWAASLGAVGVLKKPIELEPLVKEVRRYCA